MGSNPEVWRPMKGAKLPTAGGWVSEIPQPPEARGLAVWERLAIFYVFK